MKIAALVCLLLTLASVMSKDCPRLHRIEHSRLALVKDSGSSKDTPRGKSSLWELARLNFREEEQQKGSDEVDNKNDKEDDKDIEDKVDNVEKASDNEGVIPALKGGLNKRQSSSHSESSSDISSQSSINFNRFHNDHSA